MRCSGFEEYLLQYMLRKHFKTKKRMAEKLGVTYRTLQINFQKLGRDQRSCVAVVELVSYCLQNGFSLDRIYDEYTAARNGQEEKKLDRTGMLSWAYRHALEQLFDGDMRRMTLELRINETTLNTAMEDETSAQSMLVFEQLFGYMRAHGFSMDSMLGQYLKERI